MSFPANNNYFNVFHCFFFGHMIFSFLAVRSQNFKLCISLLFSSFVELFLKYFEPNCYGGTVT